MTNIIKIKYDHDSKETEIICNEQIFDTSCIKDTEISMWVYPFVRNGFRWNGIYSEMVTFTGSEDFKINFYGSDEDMEILKTALQSKNITVAGLNNKVIILYNRDNLSTKITINGKIFDTSRIQNRSIEEWINPITFSGINWQGIFKEIEDFIGIDSYSIQFSGNPDDMALLMDNASDKIEIQYRSPVQSKSRSKPSNVNNKPAVPYNNSSSHPSNNYSNPFPNQQNIINTELLNNKIGDVKNTLSEEISNLKEDNKALFIYGIVAIILTTIGILLFTLFPIRTFMILSLPPVIVFEILLLVKGYKKLALAVTALFTVLALLSFVISSYRLYEAFKDF